MDEKIIQGPVNNSTSDMPSNMVYQRKEKVIDPGEIITTSITITTVGIIVFTFGMLVFTGIRMVV